LSFHQSEYVILRAFEGTDY